MPTNVGIFYKRQRLTTNFSDRLREERLRLGKNQTEFGEFAGVTRTAQLNYEKGDRSPDAEYLMALMPHGVDVFYLLKGVRAENAGSSLTAEQSALLHTFDNIGGEGRKAALIVLEALAAQKR